MVEYEDLIKYAYDCGFNVVSYLDVSTLNLMDEVREMCVADKCNMYNRNWSCPPGCGSLEDGRKIVSKYSKGIIVQTIGKIEDFLDFESMIEIEKEHKEKFNKLYVSIKEKYKDTMAFGSGCCTICAVCTYPHSPCRFPGKCISSMEAYGILVSQICSDNKVRYYYGKEKIAYTSCFLIE